MTDKDNDYLALCKEEKKENPVIDLDNDLESLKCLKCTQTCKQSHKVHILACDFTSKNKGE